MLEVSSVYIPGWVETEEIAKIAESLAQIYSGIPYAVIAFLPEHKLKHIPSPDFRQMISAFEAAKDAGSRNVRLGNLGRFMKSMDEYEMLYAGCYLVACTYLLFKLVCESQVTEGFQTLSCGVIRIDDFFL